MADDLPQQCRRQQALAARLSTIRFALPGCRCQASPPQPRGPYYQLTRRVAGKTVTTRLIQGQAARYAEWIANQRELRRVLGHREQISRQAAELILDKHPNRTNRGDQPA